MSQGPMCACGHAAFYHEPRGSWPCKKCGCLAHQKLEGSADYRRGFVDASYKHPPADISEEYLKGYRDGRRE